MSADMWIRPLRSLYGFPDQVRVVGGRIERGWLRRGVVAGVSWAVGNDLIARGLAVAAEAPQWASPAPSGPVYATPPAAVDIPDDWEAGHHLRRINLAKRILTMTTGDKDSKLTDAEARAVIAAELERRGKQKPSNKMRPAPANK